MYDCGSTLHNFLYNEVEYSYNVSTTLVPSPSERVRERCCVRDRGTLCQPQRHRLRLVRIAIRVPDREHGLQIRASGVKENVRFIDLRCTIVAALCIIFFITKLNIAIMFQLRSFPLLPDKSGHVSEG